MRSIRIFAASLWFLFPIFLPSLHGATVTWVGGSGDWNTTANWSTGLLPGASDDVVVGPGPAITVTHSSGAHTVRSIQSQQAIMLSGGVLTISTTLQPSNTFTLSGGTLQSATVVATNGFALVVQSGTLDGVTIATNSTLDVGNSVNGSHLTVTSGLVLNGTLAVGNPTNSNYGYVFFAGSQTLSGTGTVVFGSNPNYYDSLIVANDGTTLTIGAGVTVRGQYGIIGYSANFGGSQNASVLNLGTISCDVGGGAIHIIPRDFTSTGTLGGNVHVMGGTTVLGGTIVTIGGSGLIMESGSILDGVTVNGILDVGSSLSGAHAAVTNGLVLNGTLLVGNPTNNNYGYVGFAGTQTLSGTGTVVLGGNPNSYDCLLVANDGTTLTIGAGITVRGQYGTIGYSANFGGSQSASVLNLGTISCDVSGGAIQISPQNFTNQTVVQGINGGTAKVVSTFTQSAAGSLNGVVQMTGALQGGTLAGGSTLIVSGGVTVDGFTVNGTLDVGSSLSTAHATVTNGMVLNGTLLVGNPTNNNYGYVSFSGTQTLSGTGKVVFGSNPNYYDSLIVANDGTTLTIGAGVTVRGQYGIIGYSATFGGSQNASVLNLGTISCDVSGGTIRLTPHTLTSTGTFSGSVQVTSGTTVLGGTIVTLNGSALILNSGTILNGVTVNGTLDVGYSASASPVTVTNGLVLNGTLLVGNPTNNSFGGVSFAGTQTLSGSGTVVFGSQPSSSLNALYLANAGTTLTIGPSITVRGQNGTIGFSSGFGSPQNVSVINQGAISSDVSGGTIQITPQTFTSTGTFSGSVQVTSGTTVLGGTIVTLNGSALKLNSGSSLNGVTVNGTLDIGYSASAAPVTVTNGLVVNGTLLVGNPTNNSYGGVSLAGTQTLSGNGTVVFGNYSSSSLNSLYLANSGTTLTIGPGITIRGQNGTIGYSSGFGSPQNVSVINQGTISCDVSGGTMLVSPQTFANQGGLRASAGTVVSLTGSNTLSSGSMTIGLGGLANYGKLNILGNVPLSGALNVNLSGGYVPTAGSSFAIVNYGSESGTFAPVTLPGQGLQWQFNYGATSATLTLTNDLATVADIAYLRSTLDPVNFAPTNTTTVYTTLGVVTTWTNLAGAGDTEFYMQDASGGIAVRWSGAGGSSNLPPAGSVVEVTAPLADTNGLLLLAPVFSNTLHGVTIQGTTNLPAPQPLPFDTNIVSQPELMVRHLQGSYFLATNVFLDLATSTFAAGAAEPLTNGNAQSYALSLFNPTGLTTGTNYTVAATNQSGQTFIIAYNSNANFIGHTKLPGLFAVYGVLGQYVTNTPYTSGYQFIPTRAADLIALGPPQILDQPTNQLLTLSANAAFAVTAVGSPPLSYRWLQNGGALADGAAVSGSTTPSLVLNGITANNAGNYSVIITNSYGSVTSVVATLTVLDCTAPAAGIAAWWPMNGSLMDIVGGIVPSATNALSFVSGEVGLGVTFGTNGYIDLPASPLLESQQFTWEAWVRWDGPGPIEDGFGSVILQKAVYPSGQVDYGLSARAQDKAVVFECGNYQTAVIVASNAFAPGVFCHVAGSYDGATFKLYVNGTLQGQLALVTSISSASAWTIGANAADYQAYPRTWNGVIDEVSIYNRALSSNEIAAIYGAGAGGKCLGTAPAITGQPQSKFVVLGGTATFSVETTGLLPLTNQWKLNGTNLADNGHITGSQGNVLVITNVQFADAGVYSVSVSNAVGGTVSELATLVVLRQTPVVTWSNAAPITYGTALSSVQLNASANVPGTFAYNPPAGTVLSAGGNTLSVTFTPTDSVDYTIVGANTSISVSQIPLTVTANNASRTYGQNNPVFSGTITGLTNGDNITANYNCSAIPISPPGNYPIVPSLVDPNGRLGNYSVTLHNGSLTVSQGSPPTFTSITPNTGLTNGGTAVTLTGSGFELGAGVAFGSQPATSVAVNGTGTQISAITPSGPLGLINVLVTNPDSTMITLTNGYTYTGPPPSISGQPASAAVPINSNAVFQVTASYVGTYQWQLNGLNLVDNGRITGTHGTTLTVLGAQPADAGSYRVVLGNVFGSTTSSVATLTVIVPPTITTPPQDQSIGIGGTAIFTVGAIGSGPFSYQWLKGSSPLSGATGPTLTLANVQSTNQGAYSVTVGNAGGSTTSASATLTALNYCASAQPGQSVYPMGSTVPLSVGTFNCTSQAATPNSSAVVWISNGGATRSLSTTTGASGSNAVNFVPLPSEAGAYQVAAALPGQSVPAAQGTFTLVGMGLSTSQISDQLLPGVPVTNIIVLRNLTSVALTGIVASVVGSAPDVHVQLSTPATLAGSATNLLSMILTAPVNASAQDQFSVQLTSAQGTSNSVAVTATVVSTSPQLVVTPSLVAATMLQGGQTLVNFTVANLGGIASGPIQVLLPQAPWLTVVTPQPIPPLAPGQTNQVTLALTPPANLTLGYYTGEFNLTSAGDEVLVPFQFDCVSSLQGSLQVTVQDELSTYGAGSPNVSNATVTVSDFLTGSNLFTAVTGSSGTLLFSNLTSAYYTVAVAAPDHGSFSSTVLVSPNQTNDVVAFLALQLVDYTWVVTPTTIPDHYEFTLETTFQTQVPWPVVTVAPGAIDLCTIAGQTNQINLTITNSGLIAAQGLKLYFGTHPDWSIQPLTTSLGDLAPMSGLVVPVTITRLGSGTSVPNSITAQLSYQVITPTQTHSTIVPIYVYDANPSACDPASPTPPPVPIICTNCAFAGGSNTNSGGGEVGGGGGEGGGGGGGGGGSVSAPTISFPSYNLQTPQGAIVQVKLRIDQSAVIARDAFKATLQLANNAGATVSNLSVSLTVYDASNQVATSLFGIPAPKLNGLNAVDGTGLLANGASGSGTWTVVPATNAAPLAPTQFAVGGSFSYVLNGEPVTVPLFPVPITVLPTPIFNVDYFLQHDVYSDDPFTPQVEPSIPFPLAILIRNKGNGSAQDFNITSAQPQIIENSNDLLIAFSIIGSQVGTNQSVSPSLTLDFGPIGPQASAEGVWYMTSTLEGQFISFAASYQHTDDLGNTNTSLINRVTIHEMNHIVRLTAPTDDGLPDFLVNDTTNVDALPGIVYSSDGATYPVTSITSGATSGAPSPGISNITVTASVPAGWVYLEVVDPGGGSYPIASVRRSDGAYLLVGPNVWQTPARIHMVPSKPNNLIHIFDYNSTGSYTVTYGLPITLPDATTLNAVNITATNATLNAMVNPDGATTQVHFQWGGTTNYGNTTLSTTLADGLNSAQAVALAIGGIPPGTTNHFRAVAVNSAGTSFGADVAFVTPALPPPAITQVANESIVIGQSVIITNRAQVATAPVTFTLSSSAPAGATISTNGIFQWMPSCAQGSTTNVITIWATDSSTPPLSNSMSFVVIVSECIQVGVGSTVLQTGHTGNMAVTLLSTVGLTNLSWTLVCPSNRLNNFSFAFTNAEIATSVVQVLDSARTFFNLEVKPGQTLQSPSQLGSIVFSAPPGHSGFLPVVAANILGIKGDGTSAGNIGSQPGTVVLIGLEPLLAAWATSDSTRMITIYGNPGTNYLLSYSTNLTLPNWQPAFSVPMTNLFESVPVDQTKPQIYYRAQ